MEIRVTTVVWADVAKIASQAAKRLEEILQPSFEGVSYGGGVVKVLLVIISVSDDVGGNSEFIKARTKSGFLDENLSGHRGRFLSYGFEVNSAVFSCDGSDMLVKICPALLKRLDESDLKIPKGFNLEKFKRDVTKCLVNYCGDA